jgi:ubiquinone/menaquinone biosynthesis C-methylase UbiE
MRARQVAVAGLAAVAGAALVGAHRLRETPANMRRYSMPSVGVYDLVTRLAFGRRYDEIAQAIAAEAPDGETVVDLGCGPGEVLVRLASLAPSLHLTGVDVDAAMIARAQRKTERMVPGTDLRRPQFVVADAAALPFADGSVGLVVSSYAVHHLPDRHAARAEILRVLKPGAKAIIWDVMSPHGEPAPTDGPSGHQGEQPTAPRGHHAPAQHAAGALDIVRMLVRFGRIPAERYELRKPGRPVEGLE